MNLERNEFLEYGVFTKRQESRNSSMKKNFILLYWKQKIKYMYRYRCRGFIKWSRMETIKH